MTALKQSLYTLLIGLLMLAYVFVLLTSVPEPLNEVSKLDYRIDMAKQELLNAQK